MIRRAAAVVLALASLAAPPRAAEAAPGAPAAEEEHVVTFVRGDDSAVSRGIAEAFVRPMTKAAPGEPVDFLWARLDVDGDGYDELVVSLVAEARCGAEGCPLLVMRRKDDGAWKAVLATVATRLSWRRDPPRRSLVLVTRTPRGDEDWTWDGDRALMVPADGAAAGRTGSPPVQ